jgi:transposase
MRPHGSAAELERRRRRAVASLRQGCSVSEVARVLGVTPRSVRRWRAAACAGGEAALDAKRHPGPRSKLNRLQERQVLGWLKRSPTEFGFPTELGTAPRVAGLIRQRFGVRYHPRYVCAWLSRRNMSPQKPETQPRERNARRIAAWRNRTWPRLRREAVEKKLTSY